MRMNRNKYEREDISAGEAFLIAGIMILYAFAALVDYLFEIAIRGYRKIKSINHNG